MDDYKRKLIEIEKLKVELNKYKTNHLLHALLSIFMFGLWVIPWYFIWVRNNYKYVRVEEKLNQI